MIATIGDNRKMLVFPLDEVNEMARGKGVILQRIKDGSLADARVFLRKEGLSWLDPAGRTFTLPTAVASCAGVRPTTMTSELGEGSAASPMIPARCPG